MISCSNCGTENRDDSKFCINCGESIAPAAEAGVSGIPLTLPDGDDPQPGQSTELPSETVAQEAAAGPPNAGMADLPDWLQRLRAKSTDQSAQDSESFPEMTTAESQPDPPAAKPTTEEWLAQLRANPPEVEVEPFANQPQEPQDPTWVRKLSDLAAETEEQAPAEPADPTWIRRLSDIAAESSPATEPAPDASEVDKESEDKLPWTEIAGSETDEAEPTVGVDQVPTQFPEERVVSAEPAGQEEPSSAAEEKPEELPDWLQMTAEASAVVDGQGEEEPSAPAAIETTTPVEGESVSPPAPATEEEIPDWIRRLQPISVESVPAEESIEPPPAEEQAPSDVEAEPLIPEPVELPEWLRLAAGGDGAEKEAEEEGAEAVPSWVRVHTPPFMPRAKTGAEMGSGLLEGLPGVVPLALAIAEPHATTKTAAKPDTRKGGHLFESILAEPQAAAEVPLPAKIERKFNARPIIYLLMLLAVIVPFLLPDDISGYALSISNTPAATFYDVLRTVPPNGTVLVAFDYEPSHAGEMDLQANAILHDLVARNVKVIAVSTMATGPQVAQRILDRAVGKSASYAYGSGYVNLGYIAGQEAGLAQLATYGFAPSTRDYIQNRTIDRYPITANATKLGDIRLIVLLAGSEEPLKMWMEQVQPRTDVRLIAGVSAAVEPRAQAYRDAKQLIAYISGLMDAARLEVLENRSGLAVVSVNALTWAQIVLIAVVIVGNVAYWFDRLRGKRA